MDTSMLAFLAAPFVASLILTGIHAYLGVHVVERGVIFVDLSLAQIAALGATIAILLPICGGDSGDEQGDLGERAPQGHARGQYPRGVVERSRQDRRALRRHRLVSLHL